MREIKDKIQIIERAIIFVSVLKGERQRVAVIHPWFLAVKKKGKLLRPVQYDIIVRSKKETFLVAVKRNKTGPTSVF